MLIKRLTEHTSLAAVLPLFGTLSGCLIGIYVASGYLFNLELDRYLMQTVSAVPLTEAAIVGLGLLVFTYLGLSAGMLTQLFLQQRSHH
jgi:hypothetical protein